MILNTPAYLKAQLGRASRARISEINFEEGPLEIVHIGGLQKGRGIRALIEALCLSTINIRLSLLGDVMERRRAELEDYARAMSVENKVRFIASVSQARLMKMLGEFDASVIALPSVAAAYDMAMPNKLFESLAAGCPVISTPLKEVRCFLNDAQMGIVVQSASAKDIAKGFEAFRSIQLKPISLPPLYSWPVQRTRLQILYESLKPGQSDPATLDKLRDRLRHWSSVDSDSS